MKKTDQFISRNGISMKKPDWKREYVTYQDCLDFLEHLRTRGRTLIRHKRRDQFNYFDLTALEEKMLEIIKEAPDAQTAYLIIAEHYRKDHPNCNHKLMPELENIYKEDLYEYLVENGVEEAGRLAEVVG